MVTFYEWLITILVLIFAGILAWGVVWAFQHHPNICVAVGVIAIVLIFANAVRCQLFHPEG